MSQTVEKGKGAALSESRALDETEKESSAMAPKPVTVGEAAYTGFSRFGQALWWLPRKVGLTSLIGLEDRLQKSDQMMDRQRRRIWTVRGTWTEGGMDFGARMGAGGAYGVGGFTLLSKAGITQVGNMPIFGTGGAAASTGLRITFGHGARHLAGTGLSATQVEAAIAQKIATVGTGIGASWGWVQVGGQWIQYRVYALIDGTVNVGTYFPVSGLFGK